MSTSGAVLLRTFSASSTGAVYGQTEQNVWMRRNVATTAPAVYERQLPQISTGRLAAGNSITIDTPIESDITNQYGLQIYVPQILFVGPATFARLPNGFGLCTMETFSLKYGNQVLFQGLIEDIFNNMNANYSNENRDTLGDLMGFGLSATERSTRAQSPLGQSFFIPFSTLLNWDDLKDPQGASKPR